MFARPSLRHLLHPLPLRPVHHRPPILLTRSPPSRALSSVLSSTRRPASTPSPCSTFRLQSRSARYESRDHYTRYEPPNRKIIDAEPGTYRSYHNPNVERARNWTLYASIAGAIVYFTNQERVPISNRRRFNIIGSWAEEILAKEAYDEVMEEYKARILPASHRKSRFVRRVAERIIAVSGLEDLDWEVHVIDDPGTANAFVVPGGKIFVFTGLLPLCQSDAGLASVLSHEVGHVVARHMAERLSKEVVVLPMFLYTFILGDMGFFGRIISNLLIKMPGSRRQEAEADFIGLMLMSQACYDPAEAMKFWGRMERAGVESVPELLSTHPSHKERMKNIAGWLEEAEAKRRESDCESTLDSMHQFRKAFDFPRW